MNLVLTQDMREAAVDAILACLGHTPSAIHPLAANFGDTPLSNIAAMCGRTVRTSNKEHSAIVALGMRTADFSAIVSGAAEVFAMRRYEKAATHLGFTGTIKAKDFRPIDIADISVATVLQKIGEFAEVLPGRVTMQNATSGQLISYASDLQFLRELVVNDQASIIQSSLVALGSAAAQTEAKLVYAVLRENPALSDGMPVFHAEFGNLLGAFVEPDSLSRALAALRRGMTLHDDDISDLDAAHLIVSADMEYSCKKIVHESGMGNQIAVTATAHLPSGEWFLLPDSDIQPVVSVIRLDGIKNPVRIEQKATDFKVDGFSLRAAADLGAAMVSRHAIRGVA